MTPLRRGLPALRFMNPLRLSASVFAPSAPRLACLTLCCTAAWPVQADEPPATLDAVTVRGERQPYRTLLVSGAMKTDTPARDLAQSVRVLSAELLADAGVTRLDQALDLGSGISRQSNLGGLWDSYAMRGFTGDPSFGSDFLVNGFNYSRGYNGLRDTANAAAVEVLKGPASALYGRGEPGGTVNITTKKPLFVPERALEVSAGSHDAYRATADLTGPLTERLAYRLNLAHEQAGSFRDHVNTERTLVAPSLLWMLSSDTTVSYELEYARQRAPFDRGVVAVKGRLGTVPRSAFYGEPGDGPNTIEALGNQLFVQHHFSDDWSLQGGLSYRRSSISGIATEARFLQADDRTLTRQRRTRENSALDVSGRIELLGQVQAGGWRHHLLAGVDAYRFVDQREQYRVATAIPIDIQAPVYGAAPPAMTLNTWTREAQRALGLYLQDQIDLAAQWKLLLGARHDRYEQSLLNRRSSVTTRQDLGAVSPRVGLVYQPGRTVSLYATASRSFRPNSGVSRSFEPFPAERGRSTEVGAKVDALDGRLSATLAVYRIAKNNVLTPDPTDPNNFSVAAGEVQSRGVELDVGGELARGLRLSLAYAFTDASVVQDHNAGRQLANVPRHSGNLLLVQAFQLGGGRATAGLGLTLVGEREGAVAPVSAADDFRLPGYTTVKLLGSWQPAPAWRVALDVDNLFDRTTYASSYSQVWVQPGDGRRFTLSLRHTF
jgi:iron complex outermembrane receptor protein